MRALIQRVSASHVAVNNQIVGKIDRGIIALVGFEADDGDQDLDWTLKKIAQLRIFDDSEGVMNLSLDDVGGDLLIVSQFTLHASTKKGNRPSYMKAAKPEVAIPLYEKFVSTAKARLEHKVETGIFGADMEVSLINDGPVTIWLDSKNKE